MHYTVTDTFSVSARHYWETLFNEDYNRSLWPYLQVGWELQRLEKTGEWPAVFITRVHKLTPKRELPKFIEKFVQGAIAYTEEDRFDSQTQRMEVVTTPSFMAERITSRGSYRLEERGANQVVRVWEGECVCKIPLLGGKIEEYIVDEVRESYAKTTEFTVEWFRTHPDPYV